MISDPDRDLIERCQSVGSQDFEDAFSALYHKYKDRVYSIALRVTGQRADALDAAQEAFVLIYKNISSFQFDARFSSWLYRLVVNASIDILRRDRSRQRPRDIALDALSSDAREPSDENAPDPVAIAEAVEHSKRVQQTILRLSPKLRVITVLRYQQNLSYEDLAETLEISIGTVKSRLSRAHVALAELLKPMLESDEAPRSAGGAQ